ncbi:MAG: 16S rRNA (cytosine(967)-C(5))-methyltransferase RsmB [Chthoniobacter sp.]|nr:16S rRNA (cytosine(967)-C(5))-methyltransferase RsmB [Chthoniobacter sp.]
MPTNPRQSCVQALLEWEKGKYFSDEILHTSLEKNPLSPLDRAFFMETFFGVLRNLSRLDFLIARLRDGKVDPQTRAVLRLGLYQIFHMRTAAHAAVNESVELGGKARGLINAILRRALREKEALDSALAAASPAVRTSHPEFLIARWESTFGPEATRLLCEWNNEPADVHVRANGLRVTVGELLRSSTTAQPSPAHPLAIKVQHIPPSWIALGLCYVQDPSTLLSCDLLAPQPGETVLDACAAPGGKTTYLAQLMHDQGRIVACDLYESRVARLRENLKRLGVTIAQAIQHDCMQAGAPLEAGSFDRVLVDAPCSNTGVIRRRVDVRWRLTDEDFLRMPAQQFALLRRTATLLKPGGTLVYSTCSLEPEENDQLVEKVSAEVPSLRFIESRRTLPFVDRVDGAFAAKFVRE